MLNHIHQPATDFPNLAVMHATIHMLSPLYSLRYQSESGNCILYECVTSVCLHVVPPPLPTPLYKACVIVLIIIFYNIVSSRS